jgi:hypothetical protein
MPYLMPRTVSACDKGSHRRRTDGGGLDHVADGESLDRLVLGSASRAVGAADGLNVAAALLVTAAVVVLVVPLPPCSLVSCCLLGRSLLDHDGLILTFVSAGFVIYRDRGPYRRCESKSQQRGIVVEKGVVWPFSVVRWAIFGCAK